MKLRTLSLVAVAIAFLLGAVTGHAGTITVTSNADSGTGTLRRAINTASNGDVINFAVTGTIILTSDELLVDQNVTIQGPGARDLKVVRSSAAGTPDFRIFEITAPNVTISGLTISNGKSTHSGTGIFQNNANGVLTVRACTISDNTATGVYGGGVFVSGTTSIFECTISRNNATGGGGIENRGNLTLIASTVAGNKADGSGGGIDGAYPSKLIVRNSTIASNSAGNVQAGLGGGICNVDGITAVYIGSTIIAGNSNANGGGPDVSGVVNSDGYNLIRIVDNKSSGFSDGVKHDLVGTTNSPRNADLGPLQDNGGDTDTKMPASTSVAIDHGKYFDGGGEQRGRNRTYDFADIPNAEGGDGSDIGAVELVPPSTYYVDNSNDSGAGSLRRQINYTAPGDSVAFFPHVTGTITLTSGLVIDKSINVTGPGARSITIARSSASGVPAFPIFEVDSGTVAISGLTIANGYNLGGSGGGISAPTANTVDLTVNDCAISGNTADFGGGVFLKAGTLTMKGCTISGNNSTGGGGLNTLDTALLQNCTIAGNFTTSGPGGGILESSGNIVLTNCTITGNAANGNSSGNGGGIFSNTNTSAILVNTLVAANTAKTSGPDLSGAFASAGHNLIRINDGSTGFPVSNNKSDLVGTSQDPQAANLGSLQNNGGPTDTEALSRGQPCHQCRQRCHRAADRSAWLRPHRHK